MTTVTQVTRFDSVQLALIFKAIKTVGKANDEAIKANEKRSGAYSTFTSLLLDCGPVTFKAAMETLFSDIKVNLDGIAKKVNAEPTKDGKAWTIPSAMMSAKSVLVSAAELGVDLVDEQTDAPRSFGAIRKDVQALRKAEKDAERDGPAIARDALILRLHDLAIALGADEPDEAMAAHYDTLQETLNVWIVEGAEVAGDEPAEIAALKMALAA